MEYEIRYYYPTTELDIIINKIKNINDLNKGIRTYEKTMQFNHCDNRYDFYTKEIDGRFRVRLSSNEEYSKCKISWKRRLKEINTDINSEEEIELEIKYDEVSNLLFLINNVMHFPLIESYERYRTTFYNDEIEIAVDEYPFGIALEIESKSQNSDPKEIIMKWSDILELDINNRYKLSWDDKYKELCLEQNIEIFNEVAFDKPMPKVINIDEKKN